MKERVISRSDPNSSGRPEQSDKEFLPSLHAGFALAVGVALAAATNRRWLKLLALSWAPIIGLAVVATGNHFFFDIAAGVAVTVAGYVVERRRPQARRPPALAPAGERARRSAARRGLELRF